MADEQSSQQQTAQTTDEVITAPAEKRLDLPEAASKDLAWKADGQRIDYTATAAHLDVRTDTGALIGKMFSLSYVPLLRGQARGRERRPSRDLLLQRRPGQLVGPREPRRHRPAPRGHGPHRTPCAARAR